MGKKLATDEDITLNVRLHPHQVTTLQGLIEMDKPIPINTNHKSFEGDSLNHRGWGEVYAVNTTYTVTYNYNGATGGNTTANKTVEYGTAYGTLPSPTKFFGNFTKYFMLPSPINLLLIPFIKFIIFHS